MNSPDLIAQQKQTIRRSMRVARKAVPAAQREAVGRQLAELVAARWPHHLIMAYVAAGSEVPTLHLLHQLWNNKRAMLLPIVNETTLQWCRISNASQLRAGYRGIFEPDPHSERIVPNDHKPWVCLVPGLAFTASGQRLGQGGGFYDKAIHALREGAQTSPAHCCVVGVAFDCQLCDNLPLEAHDQHMDEVLRLDGNP